MEIFRDILILEDNSKKSKIIIYIQEN